MEQADVIAGLREERETLAGYLAELPPESWNHPSLCEGWAVKDVVAHLVGNCADVLQQNFDGLGSPAYSQRQVDERASKTPAEILAEWSESGPACEAAYAAMPAELWTFDMGGVIGTVGRGVLRQLEDLWVHAQDIRIALGHDPSAGPGMLGAIELVVDELEPLLAKYAPEVGALHVELAGISHAVAGGGTGTVRIAGDPVAFVLVATGRWTLDAAQAEGRLSVDGDLPNAERILNIYGPEFVERT